MFPVDRVVWMKFDFKIHLRLKVDFNKTAKANYKKWECQDGKDGIICLRWGWHLLMKKLGKNFLKWFCLLHWVSDDEKL